MFLQCDFLTPHLKVSFWSFILNSDVNKDKEWSTSEFFTKTDISLTYLTIMVELVLTMRLCPENCC